MKNKMKTPYLMATLRFILFLLLVLGGCIFYAFYGKTLRASELTEADKYAAIAMVKGVVDKTFSFVLDPKNSMKKKIDLLKENLISKVDFNFVSPFVLGSINKSMDENNKAKFRSLFSDLMLYSYTSKFSSYENYVAEVLDTEDVSDKGQLYVNFIVYKKDNKNSTKVNCKVRMRKSGDTFKVVDMNIAGVSMAITYRSEFKSLIDSAKANGEDAIKKLFDTLSSKVKGYKG